MFYYRIKRDDGKYYSDIPTAYDVDTGEPESEFVSNPAHAQPMVTKISAVDHARFLRTKGHKVRIVKVTVKTKPQTRCRKMSKLTNKEKELLEKIKDSKDGLSCKRTYKTACFLQKKGLIKEIGFGMFIYCAHNK